MKKTKGTKKTKKMKEIDIEFNVTGRFMQTIQILTKDTPKQFVKKLNNGTYCTTLSADDDTGTNVLEFVGSGSKFKKVGEIVYIDAGDSEYDDFQLWNERDEDDEDAEDVTADPNNDIYSG